MRRIWFHTKTTKTTKTRRSREMSPVALFPRSSSRRKPGSGNADAGRYPSKGRPGIPAFAGPSHTLCEARADKAPPLQGRGWGGECGGDCSLKSVRRADNPHPNPSPEGEGLAPTTYAKAPRSRSDGRAREPESGTQPGPKRPAPYLQVSRQRRNEAEGAVGRGARLYRQSAAQTFLSPPLRSPAFAEPLRSAQRGNPSPRRGEGGERGLGPGGKPRVPSPLTQPLSPGGEGERVLNCRHSLAPCDLCKGLAFAFSGEGDHSNHVEGPFLNLGKSDRHW